MKDITATGNLYVVATDRFMSGWGHASNGKSYFAVACDNHEQASDVERRMHQRSDFMRIRTNIRIPKCRASDHLKVIPFFEFTYGQDRATRRILFPSEPSKW